MRAEGRRASDSSHSFLIGTPTCSAHACACCAPRRGFDSSTLNTGAQFTAWGAPGGEGRLQEALLRCQEWFLGALEVDAADLGDEEGQAKAAKH